MFATRTRNSEIRILPEHGAERDVSRCLMFYEWEDAFGPDWLDAVESMFTSFGVEPNEVVGNFGPKRTSGQYGRVRKRLSGLLASSDDAAQADVRIDSAPVHPDLDFFPSEFRVTWTVAVSGIRMGVIAARDSLVDSCEQLLEHIEETVFRHTGAIYATAFDFPANYGPDYYLSAVGAVPSGVRSTANKDYRERITRWRDNTWHRGLRMKQGYLREVYPINFVLDRHLDVLLNGKQLSEIMLTHGKVSVVKHTQGVHRWDVDPKKLMDARRALEGSGVILSSASCTEVAHATTPS